MKLIEGNIAVLLLTDGEMKLIDGNIAVLTDGEGGGLISPKTAKEGRSFYYPYPMTVQFEICTWIQLY